MIGLGPPVQIAYAVPDVRVAAARWARDLGAGPFFLREHIPVTDVEYRGEPGVFDHSSAYGQWGSLMIELLQDHGDGPSVVRELYEPHESGLHHTAHLVEDLDAVTAALDRLGFPLAQRAAAGSTRIHFVDSLAATGHFWELYEPVAALVDFYAAVAAAARDWDGSDPVRVV